MSWLRVALATVLTTAAVVVTPSVAVAGQWVQVSCQNPDGSASNGQGWSGAADPSNVDGSISTTCDATHPISESISAFGPAPAGSFETLTYAPPSGSTLAGGTVNVNGYAGATSASGSPSAYGAVAIFAPQAIYPGDVLYQCLGGSGQGCAQTGYGFSQQLNVPPNAAGGVYLQTSCDGSTGGTCSQSPMNGDWTELNLSSADLLLSNASVPAASGFSGTLLAAKAHGTAHLLFTATDPGGPGVYHVTATVNGTAVYAATPDTDNGSCVAHGVFNGTSALEFDSAQPCPGTENVDIPVNTATLPAGSDDLTVQVTDAAQNSATVYDSYITVDNPVTTPAPVSKPGTRAVKIRFNLSWHWRNGVTQLLRIAPTTRLPQGAKLTLSDSGPHRPAFTPPSATGTGIATLLKTLTRHHFAAGDRLVITVAVAGEKSERIQATISGRALPGLKLL